MLFPPLDGGTWVGSSLCFYVFLWTMIGIFGIAFVNCVTLGSSSSSSGCSWSEVMRLSIVVALWSRLRLCGFSWTPVNMSCRLREWLIDSWFCLEPDAPLFRTDSISVLSAKRAYNGSTRVRIGSFPCLIRSSTDLRVSSSADDSVTGVSICGSCPNLSSIVSEELSCVWVPISVYLLINWG